LPSPEFVQLAAMMLAGVAVGGVVYVLVMPFVSGQRRANKRVASVAQGQTKVRTRLALQQPLQMLLIQMLMDCHYQ